MKLRQKRWLDNTIASGDWKAINSFRRKSKAQHLAINALHCQDENTRAETLAEYIQAVRLVDDMFSVVNAGSLGLVARFFFKSAVW